MSIVKGKWAAVVKWLVDELRSISDADKNYQILKRELNDLAKSYENMSYEELLKSSEELSKSKTVNGKDICFAAEAYHVDDNGDIHFMIDAYGLKTKLFYKPSYQFKKRKDGSIYF